MVQNTKQVSMEYPHKEDEKQQPLPPQYNQNAYRTQGKAKIWASLFSAQGASKLMKLDHYPDLQKGKKCSSGVR